MGECLYRHIPTGTYYARIERKSKGVRRSPDTTDRALAKRRLADLRREVDRTEARAGRMTLASLCDRYLTTVQGQKPNAQAKESHRREPTRAYDAAKLKAVDPWLTLESRVDIQQFSP